MKQLKHLLIILLLTGLVCGIFVAGAGAYPKEEVVYTNLDGNGNVKDSYIVNIFTTPGPATITDYGPYTSVRNMLTLDSVSLNGDEVTIAASSPGRLYYEGTVTDIALPWDIDIVYSIDGVVYPANEIAGKSGHMDMYILISDNPLQQNKEFYENYALQITAAFDTKVFTNLTAENITAVNSGEDKQINAIILPGKEADLHISADVKEFELGSISLNGIKLSLNVEIDKKPISDNLTKLTDAISLLNNGTQNLTNATKMLYDGSIEMSNGAGTLSFHMKELREGSENLSSGLSTLFAPVMGLRQLMDAIFDLILTYDNQVLECLFWEQVPPYVLGKDNFTQVIIQIEEEYPKPCARKSIVEQMNRTLNNYYAVYVPIMDDYTKNISLLVNGSRDLAEGAAKLASGAGSLSSGADTLMYGAYQIHNGSTVLFNATSELRNETAGLNEKVDSMIDEMTNSISNPAYVPSSFASPKNENPELLQFVMHTDAISAPKAPEETVTNQTASVQTMPTKEMSFFEKLLWLFGLA